MMSCSIVFGQGTTTGNASNENWLKAQLADSDYGTIILANDIELTTGNIVIPNGRTVTIDLNGHTLSTTDNSTYIINNLGKLTIKDSNESGKGKISAYGGIYNGKTYNPNARTGFGDVNLNAKLTIESGVIEDISSDKRAVIYNYGMLYITGGKFYGKYSGITNYGMADIKNTYIECLGADNDVAAIVNDFDITFGENVYIAGEYRAVTGTAAYTGTPIFLYAELNGEKYSSLQDAIDNAIDGDVVTLIANGTEDEVLITQKADVDVIINGNGKTFTGHITIFGSGRHTGAETLTIQNVVFQAVDGKGECIASATNINGVNSYAHNVTVEGCTFKGNDTYSADNTFAIRFPSGGVGYDLTVTDCTADEKMFGLLWVTQVVGDLIVDNCTAEDVKEGIVLTNTTTATITNTRIEASIVAIRAGQTGAADGTINEFTFNNNILKSNDIAIQIRGNATDSNLSMEENVVSGVTHISGNTADTKISADANYWDGYEAPVATTPIVVNSYYSDEALTDLVRIPMGNDFTAYTREDAIWGEVGGNAIASFVIKVLDAGGNVMGTTSLNNVGGIIDGSVYVTWSLKLDAASNTDEYWTMNWTTAPNINKMPAKVELWVDDVKVGGGDVVLNAPDNLNKINAANIDADGKILAYRTTLTEAVNNGDNVAILTAGTYDVPTGKDLTITGAVNDVQFGPIEKPNMGMKNYTFNNVTFNYAADSHYKGLQHAGDMVYNNCTFNGQVFLYGESETFNNCTFKQEDSNNYNVWTYGAKEVAFNECTFNSAGKSVLIYKEITPGFVANVSVDKCEFNASSAVEGKAAIEMDSSLIDGINLTIDSEDTPEEDRTTATGFDEGNASGNTLWNNKKGNNNDANNDITVVVAGETVLEPVYEAQIEDKKFRNLTDAFAAATEGQTITLLGDATPALTSQRAITKAAVIDLNDKTLTLAEDDLYFGTTTFKNGNIVVDPSVVASTAVFWMFENQTLTFDDVELTATGVTGTYLIGINGGTGSNVNLLNGTNIIINNESQAGLSAVICDNGTGNNVIIEDSYINVNNIEGRFYLGGTSGNITVDNTDIDLNGVKEGFYLRVNQTLSIGENTTIDVVLNETEGRYGINFTDVNYTYTVAETATVNATVYEPVAIAQIGTIKYPTLQGAIDAVKDGETITLLADCAEAVHINKTNVAFTIDGQISETERVDFSGVIGINIGQNVTIINVDFNGATADHDFIKNEGSPSGKNYNTTLLVENCSFTGNPEFDVVGIRTIHPTHTQIVNCTADGLHSLLQNTGGQKVTADNVVVINGKEGGLALGGVRTADVKNSEITANGYGIRIDAATPNAVFNIESSEFNAYIPVIARKATAQNVNFTFSGENTMTQTNDDDVWFVIENGNSGYHNGNVSLETLVTPTGIVNVTLNDTGLDRNGIYGNYGVAKINNAVYNTFADALNAVQDGETITVLNVEGSESSKEIEFTKDIEFTITGTAPKYALPIVTFQNATVNIKDAKILIPELDARQDATINVINSTVYDAGGDGIVKSYYNGAINIDASSTVYTMQVTTMGYITVAGTLNATWQTNVYGNGLITLDKGATFATAGLNLIAKDYNDRDNTDADRVGKPAEIVVDSANFTVGKVYSASGADYSYHADEYGINVGTIEGKSAILTIKNGGNVNIYTGDGKTANIGADGTVNIDASTFNVVCRAENGTATLANNGTVNVTDESTLNIQTLTGESIKFLDGAIINNSTVGGNVFVAGAVTFRGDNTFAMLYDFGTLTNNYGTTAPMKWNVEKGASVTLTEKARYGLGYGDEVTVIGNIENALTARENLSDDDRSLFMHGLVAQESSGWNCNSKLTVKNAYVVLGSNNSFGNKPGNYGGTYKFDFNNSVVDGSRITFYEANSQTEFTLTNSDVRIGTFMTRDADSKFILTGSKVLSTAETNGNDEGNYNAGELVLNNSSLTYNAAFTNTGVLNIGENSNVKATTVINNGTINFTSLTSILETATEGLVITLDSNYPDHKVVYKDGKYQVVEKDYVAQIGEQGYETLAEAATAAQDGETIQLLWEEGDAAISMAATFVGNKTVTIKGTANVDWSKGFFFVGRNGEGDGKVIFDNANLTSVSNSSAYGFNVSGGKLNDNTTNNGIVEIKNSTIVLDYMLNKNVITLDNSTLTVKNGFSVTGREASESATGEDATATMTLSNNSKVVVNNMNGMGIGHEAYGIMNIDATSTFETTLYFNISAKGTMNVNGGNVKVAGTLDNNGTMNVAAESNVEVTGDLNVNGTLNSAGNITANIVKAPTATIQLTGGIYTTEPQDGWCAESYGAFPYDENSWVVREISGEQTIALQAGWNWMSSYISKFDTDGLTWLKEDLSGQVGAQIKNNLHAVTNYEQGWFGSLTNVSVKEMYKVKATADATFTHEGSYVNYDECEIILYPGWNYISYPVNEEMNLIDALAKLQPSSDDIIKRQDATATYVFGAWRGDLTTLTPGQGYMYKNASDEIKSFYYTTKKTTSTDSNNRSSKYWTVDATQYPSNMTMIAMTDVEGGDYEVAAFVNGELRGSSRPVYVEELDAHILILTISGDEVAEVTFKYYDIATGEEVAFSNRINYSNDAIVGSMAEPYMLTRGTTGIGEASLSEINIYPNPTTTGTEINLQATCDKVEVFNALGVKVAEYQNVDTIDALETAGIYVIRITNNGNVQNCRLVVK